MYGPWGTTVSIVKGLQGGISTGWGLDNVVETNWHSNTSYSKSAIITVAGEITCTVVPNIIYSVISRQTNVKNVLNDQCRLSLSNCGTNKMLSSNFFILGDYYVLYLWARTIYEGEGRGTIQYMYTEVIHEWQGGECAWEGRGLSMAFYSNMIPISPNTSPVVVFAFSFISFDQM